jgi:methyl-accepting chemotaxis protein
MQFDCTGKIFVSKDQRMPVLSVAGLAFWQAGDISGHDIHLLTISVCIIAVAVVVAAIAMVATGIFAAKLLNTVDGIAKETKLKTGPILEKTHALLADLSPKINAVSSNVEQISYTVREKMDEIGATVSQFNRTAQQANLKTQAHVNKVDLIVTDALNATADISHTVQNGIKMPLRQVAGVVAGVKAAIEKLVERSPFGRDV